MSIPYGQDDDLDSTDVCAMDQGLGRVGYDSAIKEMTRTPESKGGCRVGPDPGRFDTRESAT